MEYALIFDCDGVLADTEVYGHLVAFNQMWKSFGVPWNWTKEQYGQKLHIGGGKERMASLFQDSEFRKRVSVPAGDGERAALIAKWHKEKTNRYEEIISSGKIPPRPGVRRLSLAALSAGWRLAVASTSSPRAVSAVLKHAVGDIASEFVIFAGDAVPAKKPAPDIYQLACKRLGIAPKNCVAIEDSRNGVLSAWLAGLPVLATVSEYTSKEDLGQACLVVDCLGDPGGPRCHVIANPFDLKVSDFISLDDIEHVLRIVRN